MMEGTGMGRWGRIVVGLVGIVVVNGCVRAQTKLTELPRVDLNLSEGGNRGYLVGTPPEAGPQKTTRQMIGTDIEIPSFYKAKRGVGVPVDSMGPSEMEREQDGGSDAAEGERAAPSHYDTYVVQKGDSLWSIAAKPEIYGKASKWRLIFDANRELLKSPDRVKAGMTLKIPRGDEAEGGSITYDDDGGTFKK